MCAIWRVALICFVLVCVDAQQCHQCEPNTYCFLETKYLCPVHSMSSAGSDEASDCVCMAGYYLHADDDGVCVLCEAGYYCPGGLTQQRLQCSANSISPSASSDADMCVCAPGYTEQSDSCVACAGGSIKTMAGNDPCTLCGPNEYSASTLLCDSCLPLTQSSAGSASIASCVSVPGAYKDETGTMRLCPPSTYQNEANQTSCKACEHDTYQAAYGATQASACVSCPANSAISPPGPGVALSNCSCVVGYSGADGGPCAVCAAGSHKSVAGEAACEQCPAASYAAAGSSACDACPPNSSSAAGSQALANCTCVAGYEARANPFFCAACAAGSVQPAAANTACEPCAAGSFALHSAMTACETCPADTFSSLGSSQCANCSAHEFSTPGADSAEDCMCVAGFFRPAGFDGGSSACAPCARGFFRNATHAQDWGSLACLPCPPGFSTLSVATVSADGCQQCPAGAYTADRGELGVACVQCGAHAQSEAGTVGGCKCDTGFEPRDEACQLCAFGYYKPLPGNHSCTACAAGKQGTAERVQEAAACHACPANTHWTAFGERCTACPAHSLASQGSVAASNCSCGTGFRYSIIAAGEYHDNTTWRDSEGYYCFQYADMGWCIDNAHGPAQDLLWSASRDGTFASFAVDGVDASQACYLCGGGLIAQVAFPACLPCAAGTYKGQVSNDVSCLPCAGKHYSASPAASACTQCPAHSTGGLQNDASSDCTCDAGFTGRLHYTGRPCEACATGKFKASQGEASCADCGPSAYWPVGADPAFYQCEACPGNSTRLTDLAHGILGCICDAGYRRTANDTCALCPAGSYCPEQYQQLSCPAHSYSSAGRATISACECIVGFFGGAGNCSMCPPNTFCHSNAAAPAPCPANASTLGQAGRTNISACACHGGFFRAGDACRVCEPNSFCFGDTQLACPANSSAPPGADALTACICDDGARMQTGSTAAECAACEANVVCLGGVAQTCAAGALNVNFRCVCPAGSYCPAAPFGSPASCSAAACMPCPHNHWCLDNNLTACKANELAPANSSRYSQCRCLDGFYRHLDGTCTECPLHHVCSNETLRAVAQFDDNLRTLTRTVWLSQAVCAPGYFRTSDTDQCKICPKDFFCPSESVLPLPNVVRCPANEYTELPGQSARADCVCLVGFKLSTTEQTSQCLPCTVGERCQGGAVLEAQCHLQHKAITADHSQCVCELGFGFLNFECQPCASGFVKPVIGDTPCAACGIDAYAVNSTTCVPCPAHAEARPGSAQCTCAPPYVLRGHLCVLCPVDHFWTLLSHGSGLTNGTCTACPDASQSEPSHSMLLGSAACHCAPGHHAAPRNVSGRLACQECEAGQYESAGSCLHCPTAAWAPPASSSIDACVCNAMPGANASCHMRQVDRSCAGVCATTPAACVPCAPGHYKTTPSARGNLDQCQACMPGHYQPATGAALCEQCPLHEWHQELAASARVQCLCNAGFQRPDAEHNVSKRECEPCAPGYYSAWQGGACAPCAVGRYNPNVNGTHCHLCSDATRSLYLASNVSVPVLHSTTTVFEASVSLLDCVCDTGLEPRAVEPHVEATLACSACLPGSFKEHKNHRPCTLCGAPDPEHGHTLLHHYGAHDSAASNKSHCQACPAFSGQEPSVIAPQMLMDNFTDCKCFPGHENRTSESCQVCAQYTTQTSFSDSSCEFCPAGHFWVAANMPCSQCLLPDVGGPAHSLLVLNKDDFSKPWGTGAEDCVCRLGFERASAALDECRACAIGKFRGSNLTRACALCPPDTFQNNTASLLCLECPSNSSTINASGSVAIAQCVCGPGFQPLSQGVCLLCPAGTFRQHRLVHEADEACVLCPEQHFCPAGSIDPVPCPLGELASSGSSQIDHCLCAAGTGRRSGAAHPQDHSNACTPCAHGFFSEERSNLPCTACPTHKNTSTTLATSIANCTCVPGHGVAAAQSLQEPCVPCANGFFAPGAVNAPCTHCGWGAVSEPTSAASSAEHCQCNAIDGLYVEY